MQAMTDNNRRRIVFLQTIPFPLIGVEALAAVLTHHELQVIITYIDSYEKIVSKLRAFKPDFMCFSSMTSDHSHLLALARR